MYGLLLALLILDGLFMAVVILLQSGKGGGLAAMGGAGGTAADNLIGGRQAATMLTKATWISGGLFLTLALVLSVLSTRATQPSSVLQDEFEQQTPQPLNLPGAGGATLPDGQRGGEPGAGAGAGGAASGAGTTTPDTSG